jgi:hypothetical protein
MWLVHHNMCWTFDRLAKRGMDHLDYYPLCDQEEETINHLMLAYVFAKQFWHGLLGAIGLHDLVPHTEDSFEDWWRLSSQCVEGLA